MKLPTKILLGLVAGAAAGVTVNLVTGGGPGVKGFVSLVTEPIGKMWLSAPDHGRDPADRVDARRSGWPASAA